MPHDELTIAEKALQGFTLEELLEACNVEPHEALAKLMSSGFIDPDIIERHAGV